MYGSYCLHGRDEKCIRKPEGKRLLGRSVHRCGDNIRMDLGEMQWEVVGWMSLAQGRD